jgi:UDPglucose 6-dehydrogenase
MVKPAWIFDGRGLLDHEMLRRIGFKVFSIGKPIPTHGHGLEQLEFN